MFSDLEVGVGSVFILDLWTLFMDQEYGMSDDQVAL